MNITPWWYAVRPKTLSMSVVPVVLESMVKKDVMVVLVVPVVLVNMEKSMYIIVLQNQQL